MADEVEKTDAEVIAPTEEEIQEEKKVEETPVEEEVKEEEEEEEEKVEETIETEITTRPSYKQITAKYPNFFKEFPDLRHSIFAEQKYREIYSTVEEAKETQESYEAIKEVHENLLEGTTESLSKALKEIKDSDESALSDIAANFLTALYKTDRESYDIATAPVLESLVRTLYKDSNDEVKELGKKLSTILFGNEDVALGKKTTIKNREVKQNDPERDKLEKDKKDFRVQQFNILSKEVSDVLQGTFMKEIFKSITGNINDELKGILAEKIFNEVDKTLVKDKSHLDVMDRLWKKAAENGFSREWKDKITSAYLARARTLMPSIRAKIVGKISGAQVASQINKEVSASGNAGGKRTSSLDPKKIDYRKTTDSDILDDKVTLKK